MFNYQSFASGLPPDDFEFKTADTIRTAIGIAQSSKTSTKTVQIANVLQPTSSSYFTLPYEAKAITNIQEFLSPANQSYAFCIVSGSSGTGKTTAIYQCAKQYNYRIHDQWHPTDKLLLLHTESQTNATINMNSNNFFKFLVHTMEVTIDRDDILAAHLHSSCLAANKKQLIILDDIYGTYENNETGDAQNTNNLYERRFLETLLHYFKSKEIRNNKYVNMHGNKIIIITNYKQTRVWSELAAYGITMLWPSPHPSDIINFLKQYCIYQSDETDNDLPTKLDIPLHILQDIADDTKHNLFAAKMELEFYSIRHESESSSLNETPFQLTSNRLQDHQHLRIFTLVQDFISQCNKAGNRVSNNTSIQHANKLFNLFLFENYARVLDATCEINQLARLADCFSATASLLPTEEITETSTVDLIPYYTFLTAELSCAKTPKLNFPHSELLHFCTASKTLRCCNAMEKFSNLTYKKNE